MRDSYKSYKHRTVMWIRESEFVENIKGDYKLTEEQKKELYNSVIQESHKHALYDFDHKSPLVSIIIVNRNGLDHLKRLFKDFASNVQYPSYEIIVVDNASQDNSVAFLEELSNVLPLKLIRNKDNQSFSRSNNQGAEIAEGKYLLLLNNDVEPTHGWLNHMMRSATQSGDVGAVGAKLVYPDCSQSRLNRRNSF